MTHNQWQNALKVFDPISNKVVQAEFIQTMVAEHPLFENYYDPADVKISGGEAMYTGGQMSEGCPAKWKKNFTRADWPDSETFQQKLPLVQYGLFGDRVSHDFYRLAFEDPGMLKQVYQAKIETLTEQWKRAVSDHILYNMCNDENYKDGTARLEFAKDYFKIDATPTPAKLGEYQARALKVVSDIEKMLYRFLEYSDKYNADGKEAVTKSLANITLIIDPAVNTFLNIYGLSQSFNAGYLDLKQKVGKVIIKKLPHYKAGEQKPKSVWKDPATAEIFDGTADASRLGLWSILAHDKNFYKIRDAINLPGNNDVFINSDDYEIDLQSYIGKWYFAFEGCIKYVNACRWKTTTA